MSANPLNLAFRFVLELCALAAMAAWGWGQGEGIWRFVLAVGAPLLAAVLWGVFRTPNEPSHPAPTPVAVPGVVRLALEVLFFAFAVWALNDAGFSTLSLTLGLALLLHYAVSYDRVLWLLRS